MLIILRNQGILCLLFSFNHVMFVLISASSPARKLNEKYANFAKENYLQLYKIIIAEGKKDADSYDPLHERIGGNETQ